MSAREWPSTFSPAWCAGPRVRVDTLRSGQSFTACDGVSYVYTGREKAGAFIVTKPSGNETSFAGCAEVLA